MKKLNFLVLLLFLLVSCDGTGRAGPKTISKKDAEVDISIAIFLKATACGYDLTDSLMVKDIGSSRNHLTNPFTRSTQGLVNSDRYFYYREDVKICIGALYATQCAEGGKSSIYNRVEFMTRIMATRSAFCNFKKVIFWDNMNQHFEGEIF